MATEKRKNTPKVKKTPSSVNSLNVRQVGRPRLVQSVKELEERAEAYFKDCNDKNEPYGMAGLAYALGFTDRKSLSDYSSYGEKFAETLSVIRLRVEADKEKRLCSRDHFTPGVIFDLKNNFGWKDSQDLNIGGQEGRPLDIRVVFVDPAEGTK